MLQGREHGDMNAVWRGDGRCYRFRYRTQCGDDRCVDHGCTENAEAWTDGCLAPVVLLGVVGYLMVNGVLVVAVRPNLRAKGWQKLKSSTMNQDGCPPCGNWIVLRAPFFPLMHGNVDWL